jgi:hypothetical protein
MKNGKIVVLAIGLVSLLVACGGGALATATAGGGSGAPAATSAPEQPAEAPPAASGAGLDTASIDVCQILPRAELAALAGGTPYEGAEEGGSICIYTIDPGDGTAELYSIGVFEPDLIQASVDYVREYEQAEWLEGIGSDAYIQASSLGEGFDMSVVVAGEYGLSLSGPRPEVLQDVARLLIERLGG